MNKYLILILMICMVSCSKKAPPPKSIATPVSVASVVTKDIPLYVETLGHFVAFNNVTIQAQVQGELTGLYFVEGQKVHQNDLLFTIDSKPYQAVLDKAIAKLAQSEALLAYNKSRADRYANLVEDDFVSKLDYEQYLSDLDAQTAMVEENIAEIESAEIDVNYCTITSPINGVTGKKLVDVGNIITDVGTKLLVINQVQPLYIDFSIPERYFNLVSQKQNLSNLLIDIFIPNTDVVAQARLQMLDNTINPDTGMIALRGILANENQRFWPQQFVRVRLIIDTIKNAQLIPVEAIVAGSKGEFVWIVDSNNTVHSVDIQVRERYQNEVQVIGLQAEDRVVTQGQLNLTDGSKVTIKNNNNEQSV